MNVIGLTGYRGVGKDTFADILEEQSLIYRYSFARPVYEMLEVFLGDKMPMKRLPNGRMTYDKDVIIEPYGVTLRHLLCTLGTDWGRKSVHDSTWVFKAKEWFDQLTDKDNTDFVIFTDVRYDNEAELVRSLGGKIFHVKCQAVEIGRYSHTTYDSDKDISKGYVSDVIYNHMEMYQYRRAVSDLLRQYFGSLYI